jgi:hypothetical protein
VVSLNGDGLLSLVHVAAATIWIVAGLLGQGLRLARGRLRDAVQPGVDPRSRLLPVVEHASLAVTLIAGGLLLHLRGWGPGHARWLAVKLGLVALLVLPLESMHAYVNHVFIPRALRGGAGSPPARDLSRGLGMDDMIRTLSVPLLGVSVPLLVWLSLRKPF